MRFTVRLALRISEILFGRRGRGTADGLRDSAHLGLSYNRKFTNLLQQTVGLEYDYVPGGHNEPYTKTFRKRKDPITVGKQSPQRTNQFRRLYVELIKDAFISGELGDPDSLPDITVCKSVLTEDLSELSFHWEASGSEEDNENMQKDLDALAPLLRSCLYKWNLGSVPKIVFMPDFTKNLLDVIDERFDSLNLPENFNYTYNPELFPVVKRTKMETTEKADETKKQENSTKNS